MFCRSSFRPFSALIPLTMLLAAPAARAHEAQRPYTLGFCFSSVKDRTMLGGDMVSFDAQTRGFFAEAELCPSWGIGAEWVTGDATRELPLGKVDLRHEHTDLSVHYAFTPNIRVILGARSYHHSSYLEGVRLQQYSVNKGLYGLQLQAPLRKGLRIYSTYLTNDVESDFKVGLTQDLGCCAFADVAFKSNRLQDSFENVALVRTQGIEGSIGLRF